MSGWLSVLLPRIHPTHRQYLLMGGVSPIPRPWFAHSQVTGLTYSVLQMPCLPARRVDPLADQCPGVLSICSTSVLLLYPPVSKSKWPE